MKKNVLALSALLFIVTFFASCRREKIVSMKTLLLEMTDRESITRIPDSWYNLKQFSSYDRKSDTVNGSGWFANDDYTQFIGIDSSKGRKEYIMVDTDGPGAVVRWWMTFAGKGSFEGTVRVYIDRNEIPVLEEAPFKLLSGQLLAGEPLSTAVSPETDNNRRGHNLYLPVPFSKHCRITYECDAIEIIGDQRKPSIYYNICYREYVKGTKVISFSKNELQNCTELIKNTNLKLLEPGTTEYSETKKEYLFKSLLPDDSLSMVIKRKNSALSKIELKLKSDYSEASFRSTLLKITFDGYNTVWVPAGDFFGTGYKKTVSSTWNSMVNDDMKMVSYWLMPFRETCTISLINYGDQPVTAELTAEVSEHKWDKSSLYFGSSWHEYHQILAGGAKVTGGTGNHKDINFVDIEGKGVYAGDAVTVYNTVEAWWGEGDEKIFVDGESFPSSIGTGTEDYYGYAWCRPELFSHPFIAQPSGSGNFFPGLTINMRYRSLDAIPFNTSISANIELWHWLRSVINYGLTCYWYVKPPFKVNVKGDTSALKAPLPYNPDRVYL